MAKRAIADVRMVLPHGVELGTLLVAGGRIAGVRTGAAAIAGDDYEIVDGGGRYCAPGLIDIHVHGGGGFELMTDDVEQVRGYARWVATRGVTSFLVSTCGRDHGEIVRRLRAVAPTVAPHPLTPSPPGGEGGSGGGAARVLGFHLEGPYINPVRKGAFPSPWLRAPSAGEYRELFEASGRTVRQVTLAPELPGADELIRAVVASGATAAIGHTDATYDEAMRAVGLGASHATHCFNAMRPFGHRDPGVLGAVMTSDAQTAELIGDGAHVDYAAARVLIRAKGCERVVLITDGMPMAGTPDGGGEWEGQAIRVEGGKAVRVSDGTIIGGVITLDQTVRNAVAHMGVALHDAVAMASTNAARALGLDGDYGVLAAGRAADFVLLDDALAVTETWVAGERVFARL
jgi:N-acetylglucosamine-6-phosphate deacetylase